MHPKLTATLMAASMLAGAAPAWGQAHEGAAAEIAALRAQVEALEARLAALEGREPVAAAPPPSQPSVAAAAEAEAPEIRFRGAPQITAPGGWSFKPKGRLQFDAAHVSRPDGINDPGLGFSNEVRRARLGVEGEIPGGFGYVFELDFAGGDAEITDALLRYDAADAVTLTLGQHNTFQ